METFAARRSTDIDAVVAPVRGGNLRHQHGTGILDIDPAVPKRRECLQVIDTGELQGIVQIGMLQNGHALRDKRLYDLLLRRLLCPDADSDRALCLKGGAHLLNILKRKLVQPLCQNPLRHGIAHRQILQRTCLRRRIRHTVQASCACPQDSVHKPLQIEEAAFLRNFHSLIDNRRVRNRVHPFQLID